METTRYRIVELGAAEHMNKPVNQESLYHKITGLLLWKGENQLGDKSIVKHKATIIS